MSLYNLKAFNSPFPEIKKRADENSLKNKVIANINED